MKFAITKEQKDFFHKNKSIQFLEVLKPNEASDIREEIEKTLADRLKSLNASPEALFESGRDLWRSSKRLAREAAKQRLLEVAYQLMDVKPIRMGFDQFFPKSDQRGLSPAGSYQKFLETTCSLADFSSIQGIVCGILFYIGDLASSEGQHLVFLHPEALLHPLIHEEQADGCYLIVLSEVKSVYVRNNLDPLTYGIRQWGYSFGDRLTDNRNPILYR